MAGVLEGVLEDEVFLLLRVERGRRRFLFWRVGSTTAAWA
jgi:hypothetical protein